MSLPVDLLAQARVLAGLDKTRPKQANLRRAVSAAYYALFHLLSSEAARRVSPAGPAGLAARVARSASHTEMKEVCASFLRGSSVVKELLPVGLSADLQRIMRAFAELQTARHQADYDTTAIFTRTDAIDLIDEADAAFAAWNAIRLSDEANVFLAALLFAKRWSR